jgi:hypothetical protein
MLLALSDAERSERGRWRAADRSLAVDRGALAARSV